MSFSTFREAVAAATPEHLSSQFWMGVAVLVTGELSGKEIVVGSVQILGNARDGYSLGGHTMLYYRPLQEFDNLAAAEASQAEIAQKHGLPLHTVRTIVTGFYIQDGSCEFVEAPKGVGQDLLDTLLKAE